LAESSRPGRGALVIGAAFAALALAWPFIEDGLVTQFGVRSLAVGFLALTALSLFAARGALPRDLSLGPLDTAAFVGLPLAAVLLGERAFLLLIPAWLYAALARIFAASLRGGHSLVERAAMRLEPNAPNFIGPYCRGVTALWASVFLLNALGIAALALFAPPAWWRAYTGWMVWLVFGAISLVEFVVRKAHFRNYDGGPIDTAFEFFFPADGNEMGRRANAYKGERRRELGRPERRR
jgi:uncharacterized membrane protein